MEIRDILTVAGYFIGGGVVTQVGNEIYQWRKNKKDLQKDDEAIKGAHIDNMEAVIKRVYDPIIERLTDRLNDVENQMGELRKENSRLQDENLALQREQEKLRQENDTLRRELDELRSRALFRNTNRARNGQFAPAPMKPEKEAPKQ